MKNGTIDYGVVSPLSDPITKLYVICPSTQKKETQVLYLGPTHGSLFMMWHQFFGYILFEENPS